MFLPLQVLSVSGGVLAPCSHLALPARNLESQPLIEIRWVVQGADPTAAGLSQLSRTQSDE